MHEASLLPANSFVTLTYKPEAVPPGHSLRYQDFQKFMRRLRKARPPKSVRFYMCGEYTPLNRIPHFHALLFGVEFPDQVYLRKSDSGSVMYRSAELENLWPHGLSSVGAVTFESAAYVARYCMEKITGDLAEAHYGKFVDPDTGEIRQRVPEFNQMSRRPGVGGNWLRLYWPDVYPSGTVLVNGRECKAPRFYDRTCRKLSWFEDVELKRYKHSQLRSADNTPDRLAARDRVARARVSRLQRSFHGEQS